MFLFKYLKTSCKKQNKQKEKKINQHTIRELTGKETILFIVKM